jgi:hypothetical protein
VLVSVTVAPFLTTFNVCPPNVEDALVDVAVARLRTSGTDVSPPQTPVSETVPVTTVPIWVAVNDPVMQQQEAALHPLLTWYVPDQTVDPAAGAVVATVHVSFKSLGCASVKHTPLVKAESGLKVPEQSDAEYCLIVAVFPLTAILTPPFPPDDPKILEAGKHWSPAKMWKNAEVNGGGREEKRQHKKKTYFELRFERTSLFRSKCRW